MWTQITRLLVFIVLKSDDKHKTPRGRSISQTAFIFLNKTMDSDLCDCSCPPLTRTHTQLLNLKKTSVLILCVVRHVSIKTPQDHLDHCMFYFQIRTWPQGSILAFPDKIRKDAPGSFLYGCLSCCCIKYVLEHYGQTNTASKILTFFSHKVTKTLQNRTIEIAPENRVLNKRWEVVFKGNLVQQVGQHTFRKVNFMLDGRPDVIPNVIIYIWKITTSFTSVPTQESIPICSCISGG